MHQRHVKIAYDALLVHHGGEAGSGSNVTIDDHTNAPHQVDLLTEA